MNSGRPPGNFRGPFTCVRLEVDSAKQVARATCRRFAPENHPFQDKLRAARSLDPDQKNYLRNDVVPVPGISVWDYAMIGCFFW